MSDREREAALRYFASSDPNDNTERMLTEIINGVEKEASTTVVDRKTSRLWDRMSAEVQEIASKGGIPDYGIGAFEQDEPL